MATVGDKVAVTIDPEHGWSIGHGDKQAEVTSVCGHVAFLTCEGQTVGVPIEKLPAAGAPAPGK